MNLNKQVLLVIFAILNVILAKSILAQEVAQIVFAQGNEDGSSQVYTINIDGTDLSQLTTEGNNWGPCWLGDRIVYQSGSGDLTEIWIMNADGSNASIIEQGFVPSCSPDGTKIAFLDGGYTLHILNIETGDLQSAEGYTARLYQLSWSPDSTQIAFITLDRDLVTLDWGGATILIESVHDFDWDNNGRLVYVSSGGRELNYTTYDLDLEQDLEVQHNTEDDHWPNWTTVGESGQIAYVTWGDSNVPQIWATGTSPLEQLNTGGLDLPHPHEWMGNRLLFTGKISNGQRCLALTTVDGSEPDLIYCAYIGYSVDVWMP